jgi:hypothetical protein
MDFLEKKESIILWESLKIDNFIPKLKKIYFFGNIFSFFLHCFRLRKRKDTFLVFQ